MPKLTIEDKNVNKTKTEKMKGIKQGTIESSKKIHLEN